MVIPEYCDGCVKVKDGMCIAFGEPCRKMGVDRGGFIGCAFSPMERPQKTKIKTRVGQQKQKRKGRR